MPAFSNPLQKPGLGDKSAARWDQIFQSVMKQTGDEATATRLANGLTRAAISRRLNSNVVKEKGLP